MNFLRKPCIKEKTNDWTGYIMLLLCINWWDLVGFESYYGIKRASFLIFLNVESNGCVKGYMITVVILEKQEKTAFVVV